jgi:acyl carrier protein
MELIMNKKTSQDIFSTISHIIAECVAIDRQKIALTSRLINDLGMDSLDFLDVVFAVEKKFSIKFRNGEFERLLRMDFLQENSATDGHVPATELQRMKPYLPAMATVDPHEKITPVQLFGYITVESLVIATGELLNTETEAGAV